MFLGTLLEVMGHEVCATVTTATATVEAATLGPPERLPQLLIVDANLRSGSGVAAVTQILRTRFVPHIFVTGDVYRIGAGPGAIVIQKPYSLKHLERAIQRAMATEAAA